MTHDQRAPIVVTPFRRLPSADGRSRAVLIMESRRGRVLRVENFDKDGRQVGGTLQLPPADLSAFIAALTEAAAAIGVEIPASPAPRPDGAALERTLIRGRAL